MAAEKRVGRAESSAISASDVGRGRQVQDRDHPPLADRPREDRGRSGGAAPAGTPGRRPRPPTPSSTACRAVPRASGRRRRRRRGTGPRRPPPTPVRSRAIVKRPMTRYRNPTKARNMYVTSKRTDGSPSETPRTSPAVITTSRWGRGLRASVRSGCGSDAAVWPSARMIRSPAFRPARAAALSGSTDRRSSASPSRS